MACPYYFSDDSISARVSEKVVVNSTKGLIAVLYSPDRRPAETKAKSPITRDERKKKRAGFTHSFWVFSCRRRVVINYY